MRWISLPEAISYPAGGVLCSALALRGWLYGCCGGLPAVATGLRAVGCTDAFVAPSVPAGISVHPLIESALHLNMQPRPRWTDDLVSPFVR
jgi:hypothetical protein